jgi:hypothetical protein
VTSRSKFKRKVPKTKESDSLLLDVMDETLEHIFKRVGTQIIYAFFEKNYRLKREEIVKNPDVFSTGLEKLLGSAAVVTEKLLIKNLHHKLGLDYVDAEDFQFSDSIKKLRCNGCLIEAHALHPE